MDSNSEALVVARIRIYYMSNEPYVVFNVSFKPFVSIAGNHDAMMVHQNAIKEFFPSNRADCFVLSSGDMIAMCRAEQIANPAKLAQRIIDTVFRDNESSYMDTARLVRVFRLPQDYAELRQRTSEYEDEAKAKAAEAAVAAGVSAAVPTGVGVTAIPPITEVPQGPLTARTVAMIESLLRDVTIAPYIRSQGVYETDHRGGWTRVFAEYHTGVGELRKDHFPKVTLKGSEGLLSELMSTLDRMVMVDIVRRRPRITMTTRISLNLAFETISSQLFSDFTAECPAGERANMVFEIGRTDLFGNVGRALGIIASLRRDGFGVALDGLSIDLLPYVNLERIPADYFKITLAKEQLALLQDPTTVAAIRRLDSRRIILCRVDSENMIKAGEALGLNKFQGWLIDSYAKSSAL